MDKIFSYHVTRLWKIKIQLFHKQLMEELLFLCNSNKKSLLTNNLISSLELQATLRKVAILGDKLF